MITTKSITDRQIHALRTEASIEGDVEQVVICERALATDEGWATDDWTGGGERPKFYSRLANMTREEARGICAATPVTD